jgi:hypothetical protein
MAVALGRMIDSVLPISDAESLPLYRMVLKLACVHRAVVMPNQHHPEIHFKNPESSGCDSNWQKGITLVYLFCNAPLQMHAFVKPPGHQLMGWGTFDSPNSAEDCRVKIAVHE